MLHDAAPKERTRIFVPACAYDPRNAPQTLPIFALSIFRGILSLASAELKSGSHLPGHGG